MMRWLTIWFLYSSVLYSQSTAPYDAVVTKVDSGFQFVEGPVWKDDVGLLFSDVWPGTIYRWSPEKKVRTVFLKPSDSSNGLTYDRNGDLILTQMQKRRISRRKSDGTIVPIIETYQGKKFNSPNDLVVKSDGSIFFTDPDFNTPAGEKKELGFKGVFRFSKSGSLNVLDTTFDKPNGICFSPDEKKLYVNESPQGKIFVWDVFDDSIIVNKKLLFAIPIKGYADGMKTDKTGNIYCTGPTGIWVISPTGKHLQTIEIPEAPANCAWGDPDGKSLYVTARTGLYRVRFNDLKNK